MSSRFLTYVYINCVSISVLLNTLMMGLPYQTLSARNWELKRSGRPNFVWLIDRLVFFEEMHCMQCWIRWKIGRYAIMQYDRGESEYETYDAAFEYSHQDDDEHLQMRSR